MTSPPSPTVLRSGFTPIPIHSALSELYTSASLVGQGARWDRLAAEFKQRYGVDVEYVARAPGRVNIIGEHIDYAGFSVLPAAIERDTLVAYAASDTPPPGSTVVGPAPGQTIVHLLNTDPKYSATSFQVDLKSDGKSLPMPAEHHWSSYFIAGTKGILSHIHSSYSTFTPPPHLFLLVTGSVPAGSGLSSSAAMTTASAITILQVCGRRGSVSRKEVTQVAIESERLVGVNSGGMDQAASVFSLPLHLLHIEFDPTLSAHPIALPKTNPPFSFVIANSLVQSDKATTAKHCYNLRVVETKLGALLLAEHLALQLPLPYSSATYSSLLNTYFTSPPPAPHHPPVENPPTHLPHTLPTAPAHPSSSLIPELPKRTHELKLMLGVAGGALGGPGKEEGVTWEEVAEKLQVEVGHLKEVEGGREVEPIGGKLKIWSRAKHVFTEALRVYHFRELLESSFSPAIVTPGHVSPPDSMPLLTALGDLMNQSQDSCRDDYECSCPEVDELVALARKSGALGSRVTGAGWGGATVSLVPEAQVDGFIKSLREGYYAKRFPNLTENELNDACFATKPEAGACIYRAGEAKEDD
ncbi:galactokinase [Pseudohyphozyma bogoriensis]|nr:galactokinase [Pseudohyphozyma bogoriensis]